MSTTEIYLYKEIFFLSWLGFINNSPSTLKPQELDSELGGKNKAAGTYWEYATGKEKEADD